MSKRSNYLNLLFLRLEVAAPISEVLTPLTLFGEDFFEFIAATSSLLAKA